ncbi:MAG: multiheme c-type cytochrome [Blastocatellia bacterium]
MFRVLLLLYLRSRGCPGFGGFLVGGFGAGLAGLPCGVEAGNDHLFAITVSHGGETVSEPILWCFGSGEAGQTWVFSHKGQLYESRVSYYTKTRGLDTTLGAPPRPPRSLDEALGRAMQSADIKDCFGCHATAALSEGKLQLEKMTPGVTCESCHGPGLPHIAWAKTNPPRDAPDKHIFNPAHLGAYEQSQQFCGACHRSWEEVMTSGTRGVANVRFQPYRLFHSRCYDQEDKRISCTACHNPHDATRPDINTYDAKCLACHQTTARAAQASKDPAKRRPACPAATAKCASCHMPRYEMPGSHFTFTDHFIRVVRPGETYPN